jgi:hypothetical protein
MPGCLASLQTGIGDPLQRITQLETILSVERDSNSEMSNRIKILAIEAERHVSSEPREAALIDH